MRVVLDTNVLISAIFFSGAPSLILSAWIADQFDLPGSSFDELDGFPGMFELVKQTNTIPITRHTGPRPLRGRRRGSID
jgi:predicted nucleic acid-binding protein